jgi:hypothetical protein
VEKVQMYNVASHIFRHTRGSFLAEKGLYQAALCLGILGQPADVRSKIHRHLEDVKPAEQNQTNSDSHNRRPLRAEVQALKTAARTNKLGYRIEPICSLSLDAIPEEYQDWGTVVADIWEAQMEFWDCHSESFVDRFCRVYEPGVYPTV